MHLVKGVSAFLRRGSPRHSQGDESDGSGERSTSPSWPDIQFRNEGDEAFLGSLWQDYQEALGLEETQKTLEYFLVNFVRTYVNWTPVGDWHRGELLTQTGESEGSIYGDSSKTVVGCIHGHPTKVIFGLIRELKAVIQIFTALNTTPDGNPDAWLSELDMTMSLLLTQALNIVTRSSHNQKIFSYFGGLQSLMGLMKAAVVQSKGVASLVVSDGNTPDLVTSQLSFLQTLLSNIVSIVANYIDLEDKYGNPSAVESRVYEPSDDSSKVRRSMHRRSSTDIVLETPISRQISKGLETPGARSSREATGISSGTVPLMETGGLNWFVELLKLLRILRLKGVPSDSSLEQLVLHSLQQTLMENTRSQKFFRVILGLQVLLDGLGTPSSEGDGRDAGVRDMLREERNVGEPGTPCEKDCFDKVSVEFGLQLLSMQVLREAIFRNHISLQSMREHGGVHKFAQLISWAAFTTPDVTAKKKLSTQFNIGKSVRMNLSPQARLREQLPASISAQPNVSPSSQQSFQATTSRDQDSIISGGVQSSEDVHEFVYEGINLRSWNWRVADLCRILCSVLVPVGNAMSFAAGIQGGLDGATNSSVYWEQATRFIIDVLINVFQARDENSGEVNSAFRFQSTTLQHYVLHVFKKMLEGTPTVINLFPKDGVWELVFSEWFFYFGFGDLNRYPERGKISGLNSGVTFKSNWKIQKTLSSDVNINAQSPNPQEFALSIIVSSDTERLCLEVISFLELAATASGISDNLVIIDSLVMNTSTTKVREICMKWCFFNVRTGYWHILME